MSRREREKADELPRIATHPPHCSLAPERHKAAPALSHKFHREALTDAVDPETAYSASKSLQPRREGSIGFPQTRN
jgi:hypothetical protein